MIIINEFLEQGLIGLLMGSSILLISFLFYYPYYKKRKSKPKYLVERDNKLDYLKDGFNLLSYNRIIGGFIIGGVLIIISIYYLFIELQKN
ncbi:MAG: hypothetical protein RR578_01005 [Bacilli bacterium]|uniref:hypothetical protein n=1 Tax=Algoriella sp. TaxID=1872434 RepID=UPI002FC836ED